MGSTRGTMSAVTDARQPRGTAFALRDPLPWETFQGLVSECESRGYAAVFLPEIFGRDALVALGALAGPTDRLLLGTGIIPMTSRSPLLTAMAAASVQERSGGRLILGLGTGAGGGRSPRPPPRADRAAAAALRGRAGRDRRADAAALARPRAPGPDLDLGPRSQGGQVGRGGRRRGPAELLPPRTRGGGARRGAGGRRGGRSRSGRGHDRRVRPRQLGIRRGRGVPRAAGRDRRVRVVPRLRAAVRVDGAGRTGERGRGGLHGRPSRGRARGARSAGSA